MNRLTFRYDYDPSHFDPKLARDDFGRLCVSVESERLAGKGGFWVQWQDVAKFGETLSTYPITLENPLVAQWGYDAQGGDDLIIRIAIAPRDALGELWVSVEIADDHEPWQRVRTAFRTGYPALELFKQDIGKLMALEIEEAVLQGY